MTALLVRGDEHDLLAVGGVVSAIGPAGSLSAPPGASELDAAGLQVAPGLVDVQVNGALGVDLTAEPSRLWDVAAALPRFGVTSFCPTVITSDGSAIEVAMATQAAGPPAGIGAVARALGLHIEGPMLAAGRKGAHPEARLRAPTREVYEGWTNDAGVAIVTLAPELPGALDAVRVLTNAGVVVSVGHTEATAEQVEAAFEAGARMVTHLFNAMPGLGHREPGPVGAALGDDRVSVGLIVDGLHVVPSVVALVWRLVGASRFLSVSDASAPLGLADGSSVLGEQSVVLEAGAVRLTDGTLAGSAVGLDTCVRNVRAFTRCSLDDAVATATTTPASLLGRSDVGRIEVGAPADLVLLDDDLQVAVTVIGGEIAWRS